MKRGTSDTSFGMGSSSPTAGSTSLRFQSTERKRGGRCKTSARRREGPTARERFCRFSSAASACPSPSSSRSTTTRLGAVSRSAATRGRELPSSSGTLRRVLGRADCRMLTYCSTPSASRDTIRVLSSTSSASSISASSAPKDSLSRASPRAGADDGGRLASGARRSPALRDLRWEGLGASHGGDRLAGIAVGVAAGYPAGAHRGRVTAAADDPVDYPDLDVVVEPIEDVAVAKLVAAQAGHRQCRLASTRCGNSCGTSCSPPRTRTWRCRTSGTCRRPA